MTKICFGSTKIGIFYREKAFHGREKQLGKITLPPQKNMPVTPLLLLLQRSGFAMVNNKTHFT